MNYQASSRKDLDPQKPNLATIKDMLDRIRDVPHSKISVFAVPHVKNGLEWYYSDTNYPISRIRNNDKDYIGSYNGKKGAIKFLNDTAKFA